jgi:hypothetical protein
LDNPKENLKLFSPTVFYLATSTFLGYDVNNCKRKLLLTMLIGLIILDVVLAAWSLRLMQAANDRQEFSLFLAGILVAMAGGGSIAAYTLMYSYVGFLNTIAQRGY